SRRAVARSSAACSSHGRAAAEISRGSLIHHFTLARRPVNHRSDDVLATLILLQIGHEDIDRRPRTDRPPDRADHPRPVRRVNVVEDNEQIEVTIWPLITTRHGAEKHDPPRRSRPNHVLNNNWQPLPQGPARPQRRLLHPLSLTAPNESPTPTWPVR